MGGNTPSSAAAMLGLRARSAGASGCPFVAGAPPRQAHVPTTCQTVPRSP